MKPIIFSTEMVQAILGSRKTQTRRVIKAPVLDAVREPDTVAVQYRRGGILWVRETWSKDVNGDYVYRTNYGSTEDDSFPPSLFKWRPSIHMPKAAARIWLEVTDVRVERVQDITEEDAQAEGVDSLADFIELWDKLNAKRGYGWDTNPWVWVIEFRVVETHEQKTNIEC